MLKATVTGRIWSTKKLSEVPAGSILEVVVDETSSRLLAFDPLGCGEGEKVIIERVGEEWDGGSRCLLFVWVGGVAFELTWCGAARRRSPRP